LLQEGRLVIAERVLDLVMNAQARIAQEPRLPELRDPGTQQHLVAFSLTRVWERVTLEQELRDRTFRVALALALDLVGCAVRTGDTRLPPSLSATTSLPRPAFAKRAKGKAAILACVRLLQPASGMAANIMPILGDIGKMREISEGAQECAELPAGIRIGLAFEGDAEFPDRLDQLERLFPILFTDCVAEHLTEQADIDERQFLRRNIVRRRRSERICHRSLIGALSRSFA
jgi:hypothetical protein